MDYHRYWTKAFFLDKLERGEADIIFTLFSERFGRIEVVAKSARRINSKLNPFIEFFNLADIEFVQGRSQKTLIDIVLLEQFQKIKKSFQNLELLADIGKKISDFTVKDQQDNKIWNLLLEVSVVLDHLKHRKKNLFIIRQFFIWNLLRISGILPELYFCSVCSKKLLSEVLFFDPSKGGVICWKCRKKDISEAREISINVVKAIRFFSRNSLVHSLKLRLGREDMRILDKSTELIAKLS